MACFFRYAAIIANVMAVIALLLFLVAEARGLEVLLFALFLIPPALALFALIDAPGVEERKLARQLRLARMKKELEELKA